MENSPYYSQKRSIGVISSVVRLCGRILKNRIEQTVVELEEQSSSRSGRSSVDDD